MDPVCAAINHLGVSLLQGLSKEGGNVFISPLSLSAALAMLQCGAREGTRLEMRKVLGYDKVGLGDDKVPAAFGRLMSALNNAPESYVLSCANSMVTEKKFFVKEEYKELLKESFKASLFEADFCTEAEKAVQDINQWVNGKTNGMIPSLLKSLGSSTVIVLLNAIYFKGTWMHKFDESKTRLQTFYNHGLRQNAKKVQMMHQTAVFGYAARESFTVLQLPYVGEGVAMMVLLPRSMDGLEELEKQLTSELLSVLKKELRHMKVKVSLPKLKLKYSKNMKESLQALGMAAAFEWGAALGGMSDCKQLKVSSVIHEAVVEVNEEGTEAAAATAVVIKGRCLRVEHIPDFVVDHPFLFAIFDKKDDTILFLGRTNEL